MSCSIFILSGMQTGFGTAAIASAKPAHEAALEALAKAEPRVHTDLVATGALTSMEAMLQAACLRKFRCVVLSWETLVILMAILQHPRDRAKDSNG